ncbi:uncharacterized protein LOC126898116 [Daktulosphaira vitifoliae]|uniref:uncharacterized protein LOC126898116 n=1 Tax=Daktulosphaira vitifoliae TaxID=58002 RepID=UPI0021A9A7FE|nr:uncharacterized protein LOC126898116 [Daktulosphaira vitifoliae]
MLTHSIWIFVDLFLFKIVIVLSFGNIDDGGAGNELIITRQAARPFECTEGCSTRCPTTCSIPCLTPSSETVEFQKLECQLEQELSKAFAALKVAELKEQKLSTLESEKNKYAFVAMEKVLKASDNLQNVQNQLMEQRKRQRCLHEQLRVNNEVLNKWKYRHQVIENLLLSAESSLTYMEVRKRLTPDCCKPNSDSCS